MRARNLKPGFFKNEDLADAGIWARMLFAGLWCLADREGRLEDRPRRIKAEVFPYDEKIPAIESLLETLSEKRFILRYQVDGKNYIEISNFKKHQSIHHTEKESNLPPPDIHGELTGDSPLDLRGNPPDLLNYEYMNYEMVQDVKKRPALSPNSLAKLWNEKANKVFPRITVPISNGRSAKFRSAIKENPDKEWWETLFFKIGKIPGLMGENDRGWRADMEWVIKNRLQILEGKYDNWGTVEKKSLCSHGILPQECVICRDHLKPKYA